MTTLGEAVTNCRSQLDELNVTAQYWSNSEIEVWINDGCRDIARRAEVVLVFNTSMTANVGQAKYSLPKDVIRIHRMEFIPSGSTQVYPIDASTYDEMDQIWGIFPTIQSSYPIAYACWGMPGAMTVQFYPVPAQAGQFNIYYYRMPGNLNTDGTDDAKTLEIPMGWEDLVVEYVTFRALTKARDPNWQIHKELYNENLQYLVDVTRQAHDQGRYIQTRNGAVPMWLYAMDDTG